MTPLSADLRACIVEEVNDAIVYHYQDRNRVKLAPTVTMHPETLAILDNQLPRALGEYTLHLDGDLKVGYFRVD